MKKAFFTILFGLMTFAFSACGNSNQGLASTTESLSAGTEQISSADQNSFAEQSKQDESTGPSSADGTPSASTEGEEPENTMRRISVQFGENAVIYELNGGTAAASLYAQLPLTLEVEDFSTNEKIFYPPQELDISDSPLAQSGAGTLAYYAPWGDVVMFYGDYNVNSSLYELGHAVSGGELVSEMHGTITVSAVE